MNNENKQNSTQISFPSNTEKKCPYCQKDVENEAVSCPYCHGTFVSTNRIRNAIGMVVIFLLLYWLLSSFVSCEADREMKNIERQIESQMQR